MKKIIIPALALSLAFTSCTKMMDGLPNPAALNHMKDIPKANEVSVTMYAFRGRDQFGWEISSATFNGSGSSFLHGNELPTAPEQDTVIFLSDEVVPTPTGDRAAGSISIVVQLQPYNSADSTGTGTWYFLKSDGIYRSLKKGGGTLTYQYSITRNPYDSDVIDEDLYSMSFTGYMQK